MSANTAVRLSTGNGETSCARSARLEHQRLGRAEPQVSFLRRPAKKFAVAPAAANRFRSRTEAAVYVLRSLLIQLAVLRASPVDPATIDPSSSAVPAASG